MKKVAKHFYNVPTQFAGIQLLSRKGYVHEVGNIFNKPAKRWKAIVRKDYDNTYYIVFLHDIEINVTEPEEECTV